MSLDVYNIKFLTKAFNYKSYVNFYFALSLSFGKVCILSTQQCIYILKDLGNKLINL